MSSRRQVLRLLATAALPLVPRIALATEPDPWPERAITIVSGFVAGGSVDLIARSIADYLGPRLRQPVIVENRIGAGSNIASTWVARAKPDGYTLLLSQTASHGIAPSVYKNLSFDPVRDFRQVMLIATVVNVLVVKPDSPIQSIEQLVKLAKAEPGRYTFASSGVGTSLHMSGELFKALAGIDLTHIPYSGSSQALTAIMGGHTDYYFDNVSTALPLIRAGKIRALGVTSQERSQFLPGVPSIAEMGRSLGLNDYEVAAFFGLSVPAGTPEVIVERLNRELNLWLKVPAVAKFLAERGAEPRGGSPQDYQRFVEAELVRWRGVAKRAKIELE